MILKELLNCYFNSDMGMVLVFDKKFKLVEIRYREKFGGYFLVTFQYL